MQTLGIQSCTQMIKYITSSSTGQILAVTFYAKRRIKAAIQNLRGELSVMQIGILSIQYRHLKHGVNNASNKQVLRYFDRNVL